MRPSPSPTTVSAAKPKIRPPLTTLVTRLTEIIFSRRPSLRSSSGAFACILAITDFSLKFKTGFTRRFGQSAHTAMITETGTVKCKRFNAGGLRLLGDAMPNKGCGGYIAAFGRQLLTHLCFQRGSAGKNLSTAGRKYLRIEMRICTMHRQPMHIQPGNSGARTGSAPDASLLFIHHAPISSSFLSESPSHWRNARPRPYTVLAGGNGAHSQRLVRLAAYRCL